MRRAIGIALVVAIALVFLNDVGRWVNAQSQLNESTEQLVQWSATGGHSENATAGRAAAVAEGSRRGLRVDGFEQNKSIVSVVTSADVPGTWVLGPYTALIRGVPVEQALSVPFVVRGYGQAQTQ